MAEAQARSRAFVVATADGIRSLPPELLRTGRCGELLFADLPDGVDRKEIIELSSHRCPKIDPEPEQVDRPRAGAGGPAPARRLRRHGGPVPRRPRAGAPPSRRIVFMDE
ncbi:hypothetical protein [Streptomyces sp. NPDC046942]|uniref:hypothetical protein n=1 Tax=Streptomyces sp. NPDC046942 TaxID=3155137 RepID=UPI0033CBEE71